MFRKSQNYKLVIENRTGDSDTPSRLEESNSFFVTLEVTRIKVI